MAKHANQAQAARHQHRALGLASLEHEDLSGGRAHENALLPVPCSTLLHEGLVGYIIGSRSRLTAASYVATAARTGPEDGIAAAVIHIVLAV